MTKCAITTGRRVIVEPANAGVGTTRGDGAVGYVMFDAKSTSRWSDVFRVMPGESMIISAYGLSGEPVDEGPDKWMRHELVAVYRISPIVHKLASGDACCGPDLTTENLPLIREQAKGFTRCDGWELLCTSPFGVIALPGYYRLHLSHEHMIGQVYVEREPIGAIPIPASLVFGGG